MKTGLTAGLLVVLAATAASGGGPVVAPAAEAREATAAPAAAVLAAVSGEVWVERSAVPAPLRGTLGMRLVSGDAVRAASGGSATLYLPGGGIVRVPAGSRIEIPHAAADREARMRPEARLPAASLERLEAGLWVLNDPDGSTLVSALRGGQEPTWEREGTRIVPLSPRYETVVGDDLAFRWSGAVAPVRVVVARGEERVWRSAPAADGKLAVGESLPQLDPEQVHWWWLESAGEAGPLTERVPFRIARADVHEQSVTFEREMRALAGTADGEATADLLRCAYYLEAGAWTPLLESALRLERRHPDSELARRALDAARREMRLDEAALDAWPAR